MKYAVYIRDDINDLFLDVISNFHPNTYHDSCKLRMSDRTRYTLTLSEEELLILKLSLPTFSLVAPETQTGSITAGSFVRKLDMHENPLPNK